MDAKANSIRQILETGSQFLIPFFQRSYSWRKANWSRIWEDVVGLCEDGQSGKHFLGPLVCTVEKAIPGQPTVYLLIDGQQRLTTLTLLLAVLRDKAMESEDTKLGAKIEEGYLIHRLEDGLLRYKILPRIGDREVLIGIIDKTSKKEHEHSSLMNAYRFFARRIADLIAESSDASLLSKIFAIVADQLALVVITIDGENPFEIFESLNSTGLPLEESDLIRNFLFMQVPLAKQEAFNNQCWKEFEAIFQGSEAESGKIATAFYRHFLMRNGEYSKAKSTFVDFKNASRGQQISPEQQVKELVRFAEFDRMIRNPDQCNQIKTGKALSQLSHLDVSTANPLVLNLFDRMVAEAFTEDVFVGCLTDLASFVLRRSVCGESTRAYGRWFVEAIKCIAVDPRSDLQQYWFKRGWPDDAAVSRNLGSFPIYRREPKKLRLILESLELSKRHKEKVVLNGLQIEHVMPQSISNDKHGTKWKEMLGESWKEVHQTLLHTLGNLTLTAYNPELSKHSFDLKRPELASSNLELNKEISKLVSWTKETVENRTSDLAKEVTALWPRPEGGAEYVPSPDSAEATDAFYELYWAAFVTKFESTCPQFKLDRPCIPSHKGTKGPRQCFWYMFYADPTERMISVGIETSGKFRQQWLSLLWDEVTSEEQESLETETEADCWWHSDWPQMYLLRGDVDVRNQQHWEEQHDWMCSTLIRLESLLGERIRQLNLANFNPETLAEIEKWEQSSDDGSSDATVDSAEIFPAEDSEEAE